MKKVALFFTFLLLGTSGAFAQSNKYDLNDDGDVNITDVIELVNYILGKDNGSGSGSNSPAEAIDLGLPSGAKWASCNVGATKPEEYGGYYAWGEVEEKEVYNENSYKYYQNGDYPNGKYVSIGSDISGTQYDVAHVKWGGNWVMPTLDNIKELLDNCTDEWTTLNGVNGRKFTSKINGKSIFLPAVGSRWGGDLVFAGKYGFFCSSTQYPDPDYSDSAYGLRFYSGGAFWYSEFRAGGNSVRPVIRK